MEPVICDPFYVGSLWRDASFAHGVKTALLRDRPELVQTHERIDGCDIFRAGDGLHRAWLAERRRAGGRLERMKIAVNPYHRYTLAAEARVFADPRLLAVICISQMVRDDIRAHFEIGDDRLHVIYNAVDPRESHDDIFSKVLVDFKEVAIIDDGVDGVLDVVWLLRVLGDESVERFVSAIGGIG